MKKENKKDVAKKEEYDWGGYIVRYNEETDLYEVA